MVIKKPYDVVSLLSKWKNKRQEHFFVVTLNGGHEVIKTRVVTIGIANKTIVHPREVFWHAIKDNAVALVFAHNHPSGQLFASPEDQDITDRLCMASQILGFHVIDHVIFGRSSSFYSFREHGLLKEDFRDSELKQIVADYGRKDIE